jgi:putative solute:sodium symporter small subunit
MEATSSITDPKYVSTKNELGIRGSQIVALSAFDVRSKVLAIELKSGAMGDLSVNSKEMIPDIMAKYLIHNQSFLTDFSFLGFPFHYFYTAIFLLVLFVALCWIYCIRIDRRNRILGIED